jgi:ribonuclease I
MKVLVVIACCFAAALAQTYVPNQCQRREVGICPGRTGSCPTGGDLLSNTVDAGDYYLRKCFNVASLPSHYSLNAALLSLVQLPLLLSLFAVVILLLSLSIIWFERCNFFFQPAFYSRQDDHFRMVIPPTAPTSQKKFFHPHLYSSLLHSLPSHATSFCAVSVTWVASFCCGGRTTPCSECSTENQGNAPFYLHGLWPQCLDSSAMVGFCCERCKWSSVPQNFMDLCTSTMTSNVGWCQSKSLGGGEWAKHGTCSGLSTPDYFNASQRAFNFASQYLNQLGTKLRSMSGDMISVAEVVNVFPDNSIYELNTQSGSEVNEIRICFKRTSPSDPTPLISLDGMQCPGNTRVS